MSKLQDKPGRQIRLGTLVDHERGRVQIIRNLHDTKGFLCDSGNMGWMPIKEWEEFIERQAVQIKNKSTLFETFAREKMAR